MRLFCLHCRRWLTGLDVCAVLPAGCLWPWGAARCPTCCQHVHAGTPPRPERPAA